MSVTNFETAILIEIEQVQDNYAKLCVISGLLNEAYGLQLLMVMLRTISSSLGIVFWLIHMLLHSDWGEVKQPQFFFLALSAILIVNCTCLCGITFSCSAAANEVT